MDNSPRQIDLPEVMARLQFRPAEVYREIKAGNLKHSRVEDRLLFAAEDVEALISKRQQESTALTTEIDSWYARLAQWVETARPGASLDAAGQDQSEKLDALADHLVACGIITGVEGIYLDPVDEGCRFLSRDGDAVTEIGRMSHRLGDAVRQKLKEKMGRPDPVIQPVSALFSAEHNGTKYQVRGTIAPTLMGELVHLEFQGVFYPLAFRSLGYTDAQSNAVRDLLSGRPGLLLTAGPADPQSDRHHLSLAQMLAAGDRLVISLEHRIHFRSEILVQLEIRDKAEFDFDSMLRGALTMLPDVLFIDDVRNSEEAVALLEGVAAGMTVVAHIRAPGNVEALLRLFSMDVGREVLSRDLLGLVACRGFRRLCPNCRGERTLNGTEAKMLQASEETRIGVVGQCDKCRDGYLGRHNLYDLWVNSPELAKSIRAMEPPGSELGIWGRNSPLSLCSALREAVLCGDVSMEDAAPLLKAEG